MKQKYLNIVNDDLSSIRDSVSPLIIHNKKLVFSRISLILCSILLCISVTGCMGSRSGPAWKKVFTSENQMPLNQALVVCKAQAKLAVLNRPRKPEKKSYTVQRNYAGNYTVSQGSTGGFWSGFSKSASEGVNDGFAEIKFRNLCMLEKGYCRNKVMFGTCD